MFVECMDMILDIRYVAKGPEQLQHVRRISWYPDLLVIYFNDEHRRPPEHIKMALVLEFWVTND
jgi:hypothetical protein